MAPGTREDAPSRGREVAWLSRATIVLVVVAVSLRLIAQERPRALPGQVPPWRADLSLALVAVAVAVMVAALVRMVGAQMFTAARRHRARTLSFAQRRQMWGWIYQDQTPPPAMAGATTLTAQVLVDQGKAALLCTGFALAMIGAAQAETGLRQFSFLVFALTMAVGTALIRRQAHLAQYWLRAHPEPATDHSATS